MKTAALLAVTTALALPAAWATTNFTYAPNGAHYANGAVEPVCTKDSDMTVTCPATTIGGVGHTNADLVLSVIYSSTVQCRNNGGQVVEVKTQNPKTASMNNLPADKNGQLAVPSITVTAPTTTEILAAAKCPNKNWNKELVAGPSLVSYTYTLTFDHFNQPAIFSSGY